jgi:hypothetical protein
MKTFYPGTAKPMFLRVADELECDVRDYPLGTVVEVHQGAQHEGTLTTRVQGSHVHVTVRLRRWWSFLMNFVPSDAQLGRMDQALRRTCSICDFWVKLAVIAAALYLTVEILPAFLPGGSVDRVLGGGR